MPITGTHPLSERSWQWRVMSVVAEPVRLPTSLAPFVDRLRGPTVLRINTGLLLELFMRSAPPIDFAQSLSAASVARRNLTAVTRVSTVTRTPSGCFASEMETKQRRGSMYREWNILLYARGP